MTIGGTEATLEGLADLPRRLEVLQARRLPETPLIAKVAAEMQTDRPVTPVDPATLAEIAAALRRPDAVNRWQELPAPMRRLAPRALLLPEPEPIRLPGVLARCRDDAAAERGSARLRGLIACYLTHYAPARTGIGMLATAIRSVLGARNSSRTRRWRERDRRFRLFDAAEGPRTMALAFLFPSDSIADLLVATGLDQPEIASGGFAAQMHDELCNLLPAQLVTLTDAAWFEQLLPVLEERGGLRFEPRRAVLATALLQRWTPGRQPVPALRQSLTDFLLRHLKDPRLAPQRWQGVPEPLRALFLRWLAPATLQEFFDLISDRNDTVQWSYRRAFWTSVANTGQIEDAWVVLSPTGLRAARRRLGESIGLGQISSGFNDEQSVILLRIGGLVFSEVSHNGRLHAWRAADRYAPKLGHAEYGRGDVYANGLDFPRTAERFALTHRNAREFWWQDRVAEMITTHDGPRLNRMEWQP